jgi:hypothetical protein
MTLLPSGSSWPVIGWTLLAFLFRMCLQALLLLFLSMFNLINTIYDQVLYLFFILTELPSCYLRTSQEFYKSSAKRIHVNLCVCVKFVFRPTQESTFNYIKHRFFYNVYG